MKYAEVVVSWLFLFLISTWEVRANGKSLVQWYIWDLFIAMENVWYLVEIIWGEDIQKGMKKKDETEVIKM